MECSAGIIPFRKNSDGELEFFVGHPGGTDWEKKDYWAYLKGNIKANESAETAAMREFKEESGIDLVNVTKDKLITLGITKQNKYKHVIAFAVYYPDIDPEKCYSNMADNGLNPEIDRYAWLTYKEVVKKTHPKHIVFYNKIVEIDKLRDICNV